MDRCEHPQAHLRLSRPDWCFSCEESEGGCGLSSGSHEGPQEALRAFQRLSPGFEVGAWPPDHARSFLLGSA